MLGLVKKFGRSHQRSTFYQCFFHFFPFQVRSQRDEELTRISQELRFLQSNMLKEQKRLEAIIQDKDNTLQKQAEELEKLRKVNKKLNLSSKAKMVLEDRDMDTPSSEDSSPKSSFSKVPKIEIKSRVLAAKLGETPSSSPIAVPNSPGTGGNNNVVKTGASVSSLIATETEQIRNDLKTIHRASAASASSAVTPPPIQPRVRVPPIGAPAESSSSDATKPPVPSRAGVNKKLQQHQQQQLPSKLPPAPPMRNSSIKSTRSEVDSGRESDDFANDLDLSGDASRPSSDLRKHFDEFLRDSMSSYVRETTSSKSGAVPAGSNASAASVTGDEGFSSSYEDHHQPKTPPPVPPPRSILGGNSDGDLNQKSVRMLTNHRAVQKPSDIKYRSKLSKSSFSGGSNLVSSTSNLGVLEEHQVSAEAGQVTTVTYYTEPYL